MGECPRAPLTMHVPLPLDAGLAAAGLGPVGGRRSSPRAANPCGAACPDGCDGDGTLLTLLPNVAPNSDVVRLKAECAGRASGPRVCMSAEVLANEPDVLPNILVASNKLAFSFCKSAYGSPTVRCAFE